jgi:superfamily II DNA helicase RecQ
LVAPRADEITQLVAKFLLVYIMVSQEGLIYCSQVKDEQQKVFVARWLSQTHRRLGYYEKGSDSEVRHEISYLGC